MEDVTKADITAGLRRLGVAPGMGLMVHSSLSSFGHVRGGAVAVIEALMEALTPDGTLLLPSFNHAGPFQAGGPGYFDPRETPTVDGAIPDLFWRLEGVWRSLDPTHPFAAWGRDARRYIEFHHRTLTMGPASPLGLLWRDGGFGLLLGVGYTTNTLHHVAEVRGGARCLGPRTEAYHVRLPDGRTVQGRTWGWRERACPLTDVGAYYGETMRQLQLEKATQIGRCRAVLFSLQRCFEVVSALLAEGRDGFPPCSRCTIRPRQVAQTVPSDWDVESQSLHPDSVAWEY